MNALFVLGLLSCGCFVTVSCKAIETNSTAKQLKARNVSLVDLVNEMKITIQELTKNVTQLQFAKKEDVKHCSFLAVAVQNQDVGNGGMVKFPKVKHSKAPHGFGYDSKIGFFRCPDNGTYVFSAVINVYGSNVYHKYGIMKEDLLLSSGYTYTTSSEGYRSIALTVTTPCDRHEDVWVTNVEGGTRTVYSDAQGRTSFTGFRLY